MGENGAEGISRRAVLTGTVGSATLMVTAAQAQTVPDTGSVHSAAPTVLQASGQVFENVDGSGQPSPSNPGLAGVLVSNGREVVATGADGRYVLPIDGDTIVFVIKPTGFSPPVDPVTQLHRFFYIHQPDGSPASLDLRYPGIAPTGPLPASIDFALVRQEEPKAFEVVMVTDPQPETPAEVDFIREDIVDALIGTPARFGMTLGDLMFDDLSLYGRYNGIIGTLGLPWWNIGGNHDLNFEAPDRALSRETFKRHFGPNFYAFCFADAVFVMLDDVDYLGADPKRAKGAASYQGRLDARQLTFVRNLLAAVPDDKLIVVTLHIPLQTYVDPVDPAQNLVNRADLFALLSNRANTVSFSGHTHTTEHHYLGADAGWTGPQPHHHHVLTALSGSWWSGPYDHRGVAVADSRDGSPNGFHMLMVDGNRYTTRFVPAKEPNARQIRLTLHKHYHDEMRRDYRPGELIGSPVETAAVASTSVLANVFDGGPHTSVTLKIGSGSPIAMTPTRAPDPFVEELFARNDAVKKSWVRAEICSHLWAARLPALPPGTHRIAVVATNEYGERHEARLALEVGI